MSSADQAQTPTTALVLDAEELLQRLIVAEGEIVAADDIPVPRDRPRPRHIALLDRVAAKPIREI